MPKALREFKPFAGPNWYEEDCDWAIVALAFPQFFPEDYQPAALATLRSYKPELFDAMVELYEREGKHCFSIHYADREMARDKGDPTLGFVLAGNQKEAEALALQDGDIMGRAMPCTSIWATEVKTVTKSRGEGV
jgi:hypothetical protein